MDIPLPEARLTLHQPTLKEISIIGEDMFNSGAQLLTFSKNMLKDKDRSDLLNLSDFEVLMSIIDKDQNSRISLTLLLTLIFPNSEINILKDMIVITTEEDVGFINKETFLTLRTIAKEMFCLNRTPDGGQEYNPGNARAAAIAEKFKKARAKVAKQKGLAREGSSVYGRIASVLAIGLKMDINIFMGYTIYQLIDANVRYNRWENHDMTTRIKLAGGTVNQEVEDWHEDIHKPNNNNKNLNI